MINNIVDALINYINLINSLTIEMDDCCGYVHTINCQLLLFVSSLHNLQDILNECFLGNTCYDDILMNYTIVRRQNVNLYL